MTDKKEPKNQHLSHKEAMQKKREENLRANLMRRKAQKKDRKEDK